MGGEEGLDVFPDAAEFLLEAFFVEEVSVAGVPGLPEGLGGIAAEFFFKGGFGGGGPFSNVCSEAQEVICTVGGILLEGGACVRQFEVHDFLKEIGNLVYKVLYDL